MMNLRLTPEGARRIEAAHERYLEALRELNGIRCEKLLCDGWPDHAHRVSEGRRRADKALAEWVALFQHETGRRLAGVS